MKNRKVTRRVILLSLITVVLGFLGWNAKRRRPQIWGLYNGSKLLVSQDGSRIIATGDDFKISVWNVAGQREEKAVSTDYSLDLLAVSPDGQRVAFERWSPPKLEIWDVGAAHPHVKWKIPHQAGSAVARFVGQQLVVVQSNDSSVYDAGGKQLSSLKLPSHFAPEVISQDGSMVKWSNRMELYSTRTGKLLCKVQSPAGFNTSFLEGFCFSSDDKFLCCSYDQGYLVWNTQSGQLVRNINLLGKLYIGPSNTIVNDKGEAANIATGQQLSPYKFPNAPGSFDFGVNDVQFSQDGKLMVTIRDFSRFRSSLPKDDEMYDCAVYIQQMNWF